MPTLTEEATTCLPGREAHPNAELTIIYDGECPFCQTQLRRLQRWDKRGVISYQSLHDEQIYRDWPQLSKDRLMEAMCLIDPEGKLHWGPDVFRYLSRKLPEMWWLAPLMHIPFTRPLQRMVYQWIARRRYRLSGIDCEGTCSIPGAGQPNSGQPDTSAPRP